MSSTMRPPPSPTPTARDQPGMGSSGSSNTLYLYTFLTTLLLLLAVSCGIIFRSFVLRRRFRQRVEEAIAAGVLLPDGRLAPGMHGGRRGHDFGAKPVLHEVWMEQQLPYQDEKWEHVKPLSATVVRDLAAAPPATLDLPTPVNPPPQQGGFNLRSFVHGFLGINQRGNPTPSPTTPQLPSAAIVAPNAPQAQPAHAHPHITVETTTSTSSPDNLIVSVLIAMPNPNRPQYTPPSLQAPNRPQSANGEQDTLSAKGKAKSSASPTRSNEEDEELPDMVFGVSEQPWTKEMEVHDLPAASSAEDQDAERR